MRSNGTPISKVDMASAWFMQVVHFSMFFKQTNAAISYVMTHEIQTISVTFIENNKQAGLLGHIFNIPIGTLTLTQTSWNPTTNNAVYLAAVNASSNSAPLIVHVVGVNYIKVFCDISQGYKTTHMSLMGCVNRTLLCCTRSSWKLGILHISCFFMVQQLLLIL